ncbi:glyoxalase/bleomycin resistance/dioxygenase family protein [Sinorhizobium meliloti]|uniref:VOC family protein n=1 Tax=Rhizobium meliloti TaxID=382 RepID=UPI00129652EB|nr:VOC family protein [Sinorhizobium meliloti]MQX38712.1 glyoxalase/bleomycin resistance/dioxygenase family protein [Sinorhizobium meliloti]
MTDASVAGDVKTATNLVAKADHTGITVSSLEKSLEFWVGVLGFKHLYTTDYPHSPFLEGIVGVQGAALRLAMVEGPGHNIELLEYSSPADRERMEPRSCDVGSVHVAFLVKDIESLLSVIAEHGWRPPGALQTVVDGEREGLKLAYVRGPDGVTLEFLELPQN